MVRFLSPSSRIEITVLDRMPLSDADREWLKKLSASIEARLLEVWTAKRAEVQEQRQDRAVTG